MGVLLKGCLLLSILTFAAAVDFQLGPKAGPNFVRQSNTPGRARRITKRSSWLAPKHKLARRSAVPADSCTALNGFEAKLKSNTHKHTFNDLSGSVSLAWVGDGTGVLLALTTYQVPFFMLRLGQSKLYRSENYGKTFDDVTETINNTFIRSEFGIAIGPDNSGRVILTGEISEVFGAPKFRIFVSSDFGKTFTPKDLPFNPEMQIQYNPENPKVLMVTATNNDLWISEDFGDNWKMIHSTVCLVKWGRQNTLFFSTNVNGSCKDQGDLVLKRTTNYGASFKLLSRKIYSFGIGGRFLFASVMTGEGTLRSINVSVDSGDNWDMAQLPAVGHEQFYSILAASDEMVFMHVDEPGDSHYGTIYTSDDRGIVFSKSLERHLYSIIGGDTDFTNVTSLRGVFITSILDEDTSVQTVISYDRGGEWTRPNKPADSKCQATAKDPHKCSLHIYAAYSSSMIMNVPMLPLSEPNGVGIILAHGSAGDSASVMTPDVYVSDDGGYTWLRALVGPHHYAILDSGGLLVAVEQNSNNEPVDKIKFSTDEGQCWATYTFTTEPIYFTGLASEPGARSMNVSIWGYRDSLISQNWVSVTIDFRDLLTRDCGDSDYVQWLAHSDDISDPNDGCMLGYKEKFLRLRKDSVCWNGRDYMVNTQPTPCPCTLDDFLCDFGYYRKGNSSVCEEQPDLKGKILEFCLNGREEQLMTSGYRKIPGDKCEGGVTPERKVIDLSQRCVSDMAESVADHHKSVAIVMTVIVLLLLAVAGGFIFIKKYVCGGRFLVHRYSVLQQQHVEDNMADGMDEPLETDHTHNGKIEFHDDSDEDMLE